MYEEDRNVLIKKIAELTEENNKILHGIQRARRWGMFWSLIRWLIILALSFGAYYYLQPWLESWQKFYQERSAELDRVTNQINGLLNLPR